MNRVFIAGASSGLLARRGAALELPNGLYDRAFVGAPRKPRRRTP